VSQEPLLRVEGLVKHFPVTRGVFGKVAGQVRAVDGVSFEIMPGETLGLVGESGCGKSTVGRALLRLIEPSGGKVVFQGKNMANLEGQELRTLRRDMQVIFQDPMSSLNPRMRISDIVGEALLEHGLAQPREVRQRVISLLEKVGVPASWVQRYPHEFSGGQRQRIGIARAIALEPKLVVCDEAVSALDVSIRAQVINLLLRLRRELGLSYLFISHDLSVVRHISHRVLVMYLGQVVEHASTRDLFETPAHPYTQALLSAVPAPDPTRRGLRVRLVGDVPTPLAPPSGCRFHTRCPARFARCSKEEPQLFAVGAGHQTRCFHAEGLEGASDWHAVLSERIAKAETDLRAATMASGAVAEPAVRATKAASRPRRWLPTFSLLALAAAALLVLSLWVSPSPWGNKAVRAEQQVRALDAEVRGFSHTMGRLPATLDELGYRLQFVFPDGRAIDPWGRSYVYTLPPATDAAATTKPDFMLSSLGPDGVPSGDDVRAK
jgi:oligopeptide transport system ATP-binding protein